MGTDQTLYEEALKRYNQSHIPEITLGSTKSQICQYFFNCGLAAATEVLKERLNELREHL